MSAACAITASAALSGPPSLPGGPRHSYVAGVIQDRQDSDRADILLASLRHNPHGPQVPEQVREIEQYRHWVVPKLRQLLDTPNVKPEDRLHARLLLSRFEPPQIEELKQELLTANPLDVVEIRAVLEPYKVELLPDLWQRVEDPHTEGRARPHRRGPCWARSHQFAAGPPSANASMTSSSMPTRST